MKCLTPQSWAGVLMVGHAAITFATWGIFMFLTSAIDNEPFVRLLNQFAASDRSLHPFLTVYAAILAGVSLLLAAAFFSPIAGRKTGALVLMVLAVLHSLGVLIVLGGPPFVYVCVICFLAYRGYSDIVKASA
jgi:hypothetical protein